MPLVEEGWTDTAVTREVIRIYLAEALADCSPTAVLLGCTHYPLLQVAIEQTLLALGSQALVIDSAQATAQAVAAASKGLPRFASASLQAATFQCFATDSTAKFARLGSQFLGQAIAHVELLDMGG